MENKIRCQPLFKKITKLIQKIRPLNSFYFFLLKKATSKKINTKRGIDILLDFLKCLDGKGFGVYGTALGLIREKSLIKHDKDIDVGILIDDFDYSMIVKIIKKGFILHKIYGMDSCGFEMSFVKKSIKIDLMFFYKKNDIYWNCLWDNGGENGLNDMIVHSYPRKIIETIKKTNNISHLSENYVKYVYGENWKFPIISWNWKTDHNCIDKNLKFKLIRRYGK